MDRTRILEKIAQELKVQGATKIDIFGSYARREER
jgi:predicted nucleotidyltransferase